MLSEHLESISIIQFWVLVTLTTLYIESREANNLDSKADEETPT